MRSGLRIRIGATIAVIVLLAVTSLGLAVHVLVSLDRVHQARSAADSQLASAVQIYRRTGLLSFDAKRDDPSVPADLRHAVRRDGARGVLVTGGSTREIWAAARVGKTVLSTRTTLRVEDAGLRATDRALVLGGLTTVVLATAVGALSANRLARRLRLASRTARAVASGERTGTMRQAVGAGRDEVGDLADAVDVMAERLEARLANERRFSADVAHDLRTPVAGLVTAAGLLDDSRAAVMVRDRAAALADLVEDLLEVARLDRGAETADLTSVELGAFVRSAVSDATLAGEYAAGDLVVSTDEQERYVVTDPRRLRRVLSNLVRNALRHGRPPVQITQSGLGIVIRDQGPGFDGEVLTHGPAPFRRTDRSRGDGHGLGLVIAQGQSRVLGARLELANHPDGGAVVTLTLPADAAPPHDEVTTP